MKRKWRKRRMMTPRRVRKQRYIPGHPSIWQWDDNAPQFFNVQMDGAWTSNRQFFGRMTFGPLP